MQAGPKTQYLRCFEPKIHTKKTPFLNTGVGSRLYISIKTRRHDYNRAPDLEQTKKTKYPISIYIIG